MKEGIDMSSGMRAESNISFLPIVLLALVFNITNVVGFTYADRDSKRKWATGMAASSMFGSIGGVGGSIVSGLGEFYSAAIVNLLATPPG